MALAQTRGAELFYTLHGVGRPLMLMHGGLGLDHTYFRPWLDPLGEGAQLIYYDHRGNGRSARAPEDTLTHADFVDDADALCAHLGHDRVVLLGHSHGAFLALEFALRHPERLAGLIVCSGAPVLDYMPVVMENAARRGTPEILQALQAGLSAPVSDDETFRRVWNTLLPLYFHRPSPKVLEEMDRETRYSAAGFNAGMFRGVPGYDVLPRLGEIRAPTLVLSGRDDWITPVEQGGARLHAGISRSRMVVFEESGHFPFLEEPARFVAVVAGWLKELP